jgi:hypothetical protein
MPTPINAARAKSFVLVGAFFAIASAKSRVERFINPHGSR